MERKRTTPGLGARALAFVAFVVMFATGPPAAMAVPTLMGGQLYYTGGDVTVDVLHSSTAYDDVLQLRSALSVLDVTPADAVGSRITLTAAQFASWGISVGDELQFGIWVRNTDNFFVMGPGSRNSDGLAHAYLSDHGESYYVGVEDLYGGGDNDYNDTILRFSGGVAREASRRGASAPSNVAEPSALLLLATGAGLLAWARGRG